MTLHLRTPEYKCKKCDYYFIAYSKGLECPNCSTPEESNGEAFNFIEGVLRSMSAHKKQFGGYRPSAWMSIDLCDQLQSICFNAFDFAEANPDKGIELVLEDLRAKDPNNESADNKQIRRVIVQVSLNFHLIQKWALERTEKKVSWIEKIRQKFKHFLP